VFSATLREMENILKDNIMKIRKATIKRKTKETSIELTLNLDGEGKYEGKVGIGFLEHMLELFAKHGLFDLKIVAKGDVQVDYHHLTEDIAVCLGQALRKALGDKKGIIRYGNFELPMEETLVKCAVDISERPLLVYNVNMPKGKVGDYDVELTEEFMRALVNNGGLNLHLNLIYGSNLHHINEALFKGLAKALSQATRIDKRIKGVMSTKGRI